jgi:plasmid rolling circle replication initiator protein Rep
LVKGLSQQEQKLMYVKYQQDLDKLQVDYNEKLQKAQETYNEQIVIECGICHAEMDCNDKSEVLALHCGHEFHTDCVKQWLEEKGECPYCRRGCSISNDLNAKGKYHT